jgi:signal transduction histidine kinase
MTSLRARLSLSALVVLLVAAAGQWWFISRTMKDMAENQIRSRLEHDAETIASALEVHGTELHVPPEMVGMEYKRAYSGHYYAVRGESLQTASRSLWDSVPDLAGCSSGRAQGPRKQSLIVYCMPLRKAGHDFEIWVAEETNLEAQAAAFQARFAAASVVGLLAILAAQALAIHVGLSPIRAAVRRLKAGEGYAEGDSTSAAAMPSEIRPFAQEIRRLLDSIQKRLIVSRQTAGNLAHEQKTYLACISAAVDSIAAGGQDIPGKLAEISKAVDQLRAVAERHLSRAALAGQSSAGVPFDWQTDLQDLRRTLLGIYAEKGISVEIRAHTVPQIRIEKQDGMELLGIVLDNACRFAGGVVRITLEADGVDVEDDGRGVSEEKMNLLTVRGARIDERTESGLGLSIAQDIAESYGAEIQFSRSELGGLKVRLRA